MKYIHNSKEFRERRKYLRRNATPQEYKLWFALSQRKLGYKFRRQHSMGQFIVDFYCPEKRLVIELDGNQHNVPEAQAYDRERTFYLESLQSTIVRFKNSEIDLDMNLVLGKIKLLLHSL